MYTCCHTRTNTDHGLYAMRRITFLFLFLFLFLLCYANRENWGHMYIVNRFVKFVVGLSSTSVDTHAENQINEKYRDIY